MRIIVLGGTGSFPEAALDGAEVVVVSTSDPSVLDALRQVPNGPRIFDLQGDLGAELERLPAYEGVGW